MQVAARRGEVRARSRRAARARRTANVNVNKMNSNSLAYTDFCMQYDAIIYGTNFRNSAFFLVRAGNGKSLERDRTRAGGAARKRIIHFYANAEITIITFAFLQRNGAIAQNTYFRVRFFRFASCFASSPLASNSGSRTGACPVRDSIHVEAGKERRMKLMIS